jgi:site-specific recombinase XerD
MVVDEKVLGKLNNEMIIREFSPATRQVYLNYNRMFLAFTDKSPDELNLEDVKTFLAYLVTDRNYSPRSRNLVLAALRFCYDEMLDTMLIGRKIKSIKPTEKEPGLLTKKELLQIYDRLENLKHKVFFGVLAGSGLRVSECICLTFTDFNLKEGLIAIKKAKGRKFRHAIMSKKTVQDIKTYQQERSDDPNPHVFCREGSRKHISRQRAWSIVRRAATHAGIAKEVYPHLLRASFATNFLEQGNDIGEAQELLGHVSIDTTRIYAKFSRGRIRKLKSPL